MEYCIPGLETERLLLRPFEKSDLNDFFDCCKNPHLGDNAGWMPHRTIEESEAILNEVFIGQPGMWAIVSLEDNRLIGSIGLIKDPLRNDHSSKMMGYWLHEDYWGRGLISEAVEAVLYFGFEQLELNLITINCYPHNARSLRVIERFGFTYEGTLHQADELYDGRVLDLQCFFLTRKEYFERQGLCAD